MQRIITTVLCVLIGLLVVMLPAGVFAQEDLKGEIEQIKKQLAEMDSLKARLADLEKKLDESEKQRKAQETQTPPILSAFKGEKVKVDGRIFLGVFDTGDQGGTPNWSTDIPDAKLRFTFNPAKNVTVVNRFSNNRAQTNGFDYFYLDYAGAITPNNIIRLGQRKIDVGQETWMDNPIENILITTTASGVSGYGTGIALDGRFSEAKNAPLYEIGYVNGARGVMTRPTSSIPYNIKLGSALPRNLFASASFFDSGRLRNANGNADAPAITVANLTTSPSGAPVEWRRKLWELDLRYNFGPTGIRSILPSTDLPKTMVALAYGIFDDDAYDGTEREGSYWYAQGLYNFTRKLYGAARYSTVDLDDAVLAKLSTSPVAVNSYQRTSFGLGYRLNDYTDLKTEYTLNDTDGGASEPSLNQWAIGVASKF